MLGRSGPAALALEKLKCLVESKWTYLVVGLVAAAPGS